MSKGKENNPHPFGGWFGTIGLIVGFGYGAQIGGGEWLVAIGGALVGAWVGVVIEHIIARLILIALLVIMIFARHAFFDALSEYVSYIEPTARYEMHAGADLDGACRFHPSCFAGDAGGLS